MSKLVTKLMAIAITLSLCAVQASAACFLTILGQGSETNANTCPTENGQFWVTVSDLIRWSDQLRNTTVATSYLNFACSTDTAVITRSQGLWVDEDILFNYYKVELAYRTTNVPNTKFVLDEVYSLSCGRNNPSPVVLNFEQSALQFTSPESGVDFDLESNGTKPRIGWTQANSDVAFLIRGTSVTNGSDLFGNLNPQAPPLFEGESENGYRALRVFDNGDKEITSADPIWQELHLWFDRNHNGISEPEEVESLASRGVVSISLEYLEVGKKDRYGNKQRQKAPFSLGDNSTRWSTDFYPAISITPSSASEQTIH